MAKVSSKQFYWFILSPKKGILYYDKHTGQFGQPQLGDALYKEFKGIEKGFIDGKKSMPVLTISGLKYVTYKEYCELGNSNRLFGKDARYSLFSQIITVTENENVIWRFLIHIGRNGRMYSKFKYVKIPSLLVFPKYGAINIQDGLVGVSQVVNLKGGVLEESVNMSEMRRQVGYGFTVVSQNKTNILALLLKCEGMYLTVTIVNVKLTSGSVSILVSKKLHLGKSFIDVHGISVEYSTESNVRCKFFLQESSNITESILFEISCYKNNELLVKTSKENKGCGYSFNKDIHY